MSGHTISPPDSILSMTKRLQWLCLTLFLLCGFTITPIAAAELDDPTQVYTVKYGNNAASLVVNKYTGILPMFLRADGGAGAQAYEINAADIMEFLLEDPQNGVLESDSGTTEVSFEEICQYVRDNPELDLAITASENGSLYPSHTAGFLNKLPKWVKVVATIAVVAACTYVIVHTGGDLCVAYGAVMASISFVDRIWE